MAHFAEMLGNDVASIIVVNNVDIDGGEFPESEPLGQAFLAACGISGDFLQCSYSGSFRGAYPGPGWTYDPALDEFIAPPAPEPIEETP